MDLVEWLLGGSWQRRLADVLLRQFARRRVAALNRLNEADEQHRTLKGLVALAADTRFGRDHGFARIRTIADFRDRVPLRDYEAFWRDYWQPAFPRLQGVSWPERIPYLALSSGTTSGSTKYLPLSPSLIRSNTRAALTSLAWFLDAHPGTPLLTGRLFFLGGSTDLVELSARPRVQGGDLSGIAAVEAPAWMRPFSFPPVELALLRDWEEKMNRLARTAAGLPITMLSGVPSWMLVLFERLRQVTGKNTLAEIWPSLRLVLHGGTSFEPYRDLFREQLGSADITCSEVYPASEGYIAAQDHRTGLLRLIVDHGIFYEFVPVSELGADRPTRHTVADLETGVNYAIVLTTCAGLFAYVLGDTVRFEQRRPPLLQFTGRTKYFLSAFGEHLIAEEVERAVAVAARVCDCAVIDFHVGPVYPEQSSRPGHHCYLIEFAGKRPDLSHFARTLDAELCRLNEDYAAHRQGDLTMLLPEIVPVPSGGFAAWMKAQGKLGGQHKVPRMDNTGQMTRQMRQFFETISGNAG